MNMNTKILYKWPCCLSPTWTLCPHAFMSTISPSRYSVTPGISNFLTPVLSLWLHLKTNHITEQLPTCSDFKLAMYSVWTYLITFEFLVESYIATWHTILFKFWKPDISQLFGNKNYLREKLFLQTESSKEHVQLWVTQQILSELLINLLL